MTQPRLWSKFLIGSFPLWLFFTLSIVLIHPGTRLDSGALVAFRMVVSALGPGAVVYVLVGRYQWPRPFRLSSLAVHAALALGYSAVWVALNALFVAFLRVGPPVTVGPGLTAYAVVGVWLYSIIAGASRATHAAERAARAEAHAARSQLAALRTQLNPHFLFNAMHAIVQLIPVDPARATETAERISDLLRAAIDEDRDLIPLRDEMTFVRRYLEMEELRFGDRLTITLDIAPGAEELVVPSFGVHCLVENAVRHGVETTVGATELTVVASATPDILTIVVRDNGLRGGPSNAGAGTGLARLRDRLSALFGSSATLTAGALPSRGFESRLRVPAQAVAE